MEALTVLLFFVVVNALRYYYTTEQARHGPSLSQAAPTALVRPSRGALARCRRLVELGDAVPAHALTACQAQTVRKRSKALVLAEEAVGLRDLAKEMQSPATFAKSALLERQANKLDKQITDMRVDSAPAVDPNFLNGLRAVKVRCLRPCTPASHALCSRLLGLCAAAAPRSTPVRSCC